ncbi:MAG: chitobiase/beta-hexosaminidase C-terminal domain-containing protein [Verrucomicrobia bacterium]|nr:chitobiase/beta-hexosaminidase C-terminal domain-containing protein [Verrucomicrobiota bacterium]
MPIAVALAGLPGWLPAWTPGTYPAGSYNFTVDANNRNDVVSFWHGVYQASEGYWDRCAWTGNYDAVSPYDSGVGSTSAAFVADVERRLNFFRALCSVPALVRLNTGATVLIDATDPRNLYHPASVPPLSATTTKTDASQRGAYMIIRTYGFSVGGTVYPGMGPGNNPGAAMSHTPPQATCVAWTTAAWNANYQGNLAFGFYGPAAVDAYMAENVLNPDSTWNAEVGHRRWALYPYSTDFSTGDTPGAFDSITRQTRPPSNVLYAVPKSTEYAAVAPRFVAYPPAGYVPAALNSRYWSLSYPGAGFASATVAMTTAAGVGVPVTVTVRGGAFGNSAIVWSVPVAVAATAVSADTKFNVTVAAMTGAGVPASYSYSVTLINPNQLTSDQSLFGPGTPHTYMPATYQLIPPSHAEAIQVNCFQPVATAWAETAEDSPEPRVIANTASSYDFRSAAYFSSYPPPYFVPIAGSKSFRLTFPVWYDPRLNGVPEQSFELDRDILPTGSSQLNFNYRRGLMSPDTKLVVETSNDGGVTWSQQGDAIIGNNAIDAAAFSDSRPLAQSSVPIRVRFRFYFVYSPTAGLFADQVLGTDDYRLFPTGIFIDDISTTNCQWLELKKANDLAPTATSFVFNSQSAGMPLSNNLELGLRMRTKLGNRWMPYGPMKSLTLNEAHPTDYPVFNPPGGAYAAGQAITISGESNSTIHYRITGSTELAAASPASVGTVPADSATLTITAYACKSGKTDSELVSASFTKSEFKTWMNTYFPGVTDPGIVGSAADPDHDGQANSVEFALGGNPNSGSGRAKVYVLTNDGSGGSGARKLLLTIAVRVGTPAFTGAPSPAATCDEVTYAVQGMDKSNPGFTSPVSVVPAVTGGLPAAPAGYEYRTFKLDASSGLIGKGFLRTQVTTTP